MVSAEQATRRVFAYLEQRLTLLEHEGAGRGPWMLMAGRGATRGMVRCFTAPGLDKLVLLTLEDGEQLDAAMLMAFGAPDSPLPHLLLDAARVGRDFAVFVDLVHRVDLSTQAAYVRAVYGPLTQVQEGLAKHPQLKASPVPHSLVPYVSPWMTGFRLGQAQLPQLFELVAPFVSQWQALHKGGLDGLSFDRPQLRARDLLHRANIFSKEADPVWNVLGHLIGDTNAERVIELLRKHGVPPSPSVRPPPE